MIERILQALEMLGIKKHGRVTKVAEATRYSKPMISMVFAGKEAMDDKLLRAICMAYRINEEWVRTGNGDIFRITPPNFNEIIEFISGGNVSSIELNIGHGKTMAASSLYENLRVSSEDVKKRMKEIGVPVGSPTRTVPVISKAQAGDFGYWEDCYPVGEGMTRIECPADITDPHAFAFQVEGDSMYPRYMHGEHVIVDTTKPVHNNDDVVVKLTDGAVMVKRYKMMRDMVFLESYNPAVEPIPVLDGDIECCFKVVCRR